MRERHVATVDPGDPARDREPEARAAVERTGCIDAVEALEDVRLDVSRDARTVVADHDVVPGRVLNELDADGAARRGVPDRVIEKIDNQSPQQVLVARERGRRAGPGADGDAMGIRRTA